MSHSPQIHRVILHTRTVATTRRHSLIIKFAQGDTFLIFCRVYVNPCVCVNLKRRQAQDRETTTPEYTCERVNAKWNDRSRIISPRSRNLPCDISRMKTHHCHIQVTVSYSCGFAGVQENMYYSGESSAGKVRAKLTFKQRDEQTSYNQELQRTKQKETCGTRSRKGFEI